jgi:molybdopterin/thiamine biosynthesis adenylyltransferase
MPPIAAELGPDERARYARQLALPEIGESGQLRLRRASVLVIGCGGLGSPAATYLASAGVGTLGLMDGDRVELSNLQRQFLHGTGDIGRLKVESAAEMLRALNPHTELQLFPARFEHGHASMLASFNFIVDATDNFGSKFAIADACHAAGKPYSHGGIRGFFGQTMTVFPGQSTCYRCVFDAPPPSSDEPARGPLGVIPGVIGAIQAAEAIRFVVGVGKLLVDRLVTFDGNAVSFRSIPLRRNPDCLLCHG